MNLDQMVHEYRNAPQAERPRQICLQDPELWYIPKGFEDVPQAMMFWAPKTIQAIAGRRVSNRTGTKAEADVGPEAPNTLLSRHTSTTLVASVALASEPKAHQLRLLCQHLEMV